MTKKRFRSWLVAACLAVVAVPAQAVVVSGDFSGVIFVGFDANDTLGLGADLTNQPITGRIAYQTDLAPAESDPSDTTALYQTASPLLAWLSLTDLRIGGQPVLAPPAPSGGTDLSARTVTFETDGSLFGIAYQDAYMAATGEEVGLGLSLLLAGGPAFPSQALPLSLDAADFPVLPFSPSSVYVVDPLAGTPVDIQGFFVVTGFSLAAAGVPAPGVLALLGLGLAGFALQRRTRRSR